MATITLFLFADPAMFALGVVLNISWLKWLSMMLFVGMMVAMLIYGLALAFLIPVEVARNWSTLNQRTKIVSAIAVGAIMTGMFIIISCGVYLWLG